jgi:hypothetical protein
MAKTPTDDNVESKPTFESILDTPSVDVSRPKPIPHGHYLAMVKGQPNHGFAKTGTEFIEFTMQPLEADEDVDPEELQTSLTKGNGDVIALSDRSLRLTFYLTDGALWRLKKFLTDLGIEEMNGKKSLKLREMVEMAPGRQCLVNVKHVPSPDGEGTFANIDKTAPVPA